MKCWSVYAILGVLAVGVSGCFLHTEGLGTSTGGAGGASSSTGGAGGTGGDTCNDGDIRSCYSGLPTTQDIGACKAGQQACQDNEWGPCLGEVVPVTDVTCDGVDADCDGNDDVAQGCAAFEIVDSCYGVLLMDQNGMVVMDGSSPDKATCFNGTVTAFVQPGDRMYFLDDDDTMIVTFWNIEPQSILYNAQSKNATFDHAAMLLQYKAGGFGSNGFTQSVTPVANGLEYQFVRKVVNDKLPSYFLSL